VLISDGRDEPGRPGAIRPGEAASLAREQGLVVHVIALGPERAEPGSATKSAAEDRPPRFEDATLAEIADRGGGRVFTADGPGGLSDAFAELDTLERSSQTEEIPMRYREWFPEFAGLALGALVLELLLRWTRFRMLP
jgi:Ca-activated chloride channel family protein